MQQNEGYWGPGSGFAIAAQYNETTEWKVTFDQAGTYEFEVSLIYAPDGEVVAGITERVTVEVLPEEPEAKAMTVEPATGATIKEGQTIIVTAEGADDLRVMLWAKGIGSVEEARLAYDEKVFSSRTTDLIAGGMDIVEDNGVFTITIDQNLIDILEKGIQYADGGVPSEGNYTWSAGNATTWLITPETDGDAVGRICDLGWRKGK
ncbi:MAG: hypothetical protein ACOX4T_10965 [Acetivibrionales bacterium]